MMPEQENELNENMEDGAPETNPTEDEQDADATDEITEPTESPEISEPTEESTESAEISEPTEEIEDTAEAEIEDPIERIRRELEEEERLKNEAEELGDTAEDVDDSILVEPAELESLVSEETYNKDNIKMDLLLNVHLNVSIELGRTKMLIKDILKLGVGSIVELNKLAGEPVDLLVNNKKFGEGEVVVVDENFGVRIINLLSPAEQISKAIS